MTPSLRSSAAAAVRIFAIAGACALAALSGGPAATPGETREPVTSGAMVYAVAHRGAPRAAPENTIAAHEAAIEQGAAVIEMDVRMTRDGHFVLMHDARIDRTTNGRGRVAELTLSEIKRLDAGSWYSPEFAGERVPTLREALQNLKRRTAVDVDFKSGPPNSGELIAGILDAEGYRDGPLVTVFARARHYDRLTGVFGRYELRPHYVDRRTTRMRAAEGVEIMGLRRWSFSRGAVRDIRDNGMVLFANTMGSDDGPEGFADSIDAGARFVQTDRIDELVAWLDTRGVLATCVPARDLTCWSPEIRRESAERQAGEEYGR